MPSERDLALARTFDVLSHPVRIEMLRQLSVPRTLGEIEVRVPDDAGGRPIARQSVREHLDRLLDAGLVQSRPTRRDRGTTLEYVVNHQALFVVTEGARALASLRPAVEPRVTTLDGARPGTGRPEGPVLVLVRGLNEGTSFDLATREKDRRWIVGRSREADISLDYDPYLSSSNTVVRFDGKGYHVNPVPEARNGTAVNFRAVPQGASVELRHGDVVSVGRSLLLFWS